MSSFYKDDARAIDAWLAVANSPSTRVMLQFAHSPTVKLMRELADGPMARLMRQIAESPSTKLMREIAEGPTGRLMRQMAEGPTAKLMRELATSSMTRQLADYFDSSTVKAMRELATSSVARQLADFDGPAGKAMRELATGSVTRQLAAYLSSPEVEAAFASSEDINADRDFSMPANDNAAIAFAVFALDWLTRSLQSAGSVLSKRNTLRLAEVLIPLIVAAIFEYYLFAKTGEEIVADGDRTRGMIGQLLEEDRQNAKKLASGADDLRAKLEKLEALQQLIERELSHAMLGQFRYVRRTVPICTTKTFCRNRVAMLDPGTEVQIVEFAGKWAHIMALTDSGEVTGWVPKKYLTRQR